MGRQVGPDREGQTPRVPLPPSETGLLILPRSIESPNLGFCTDVLLPHLLEDDLGQLSDLEPEPDSQNWQHTVGRDVVAGLSQREIDRQEVINGEACPSPATPSPVRTVPRVGSGGSTRSMVLSL